MPVILEWEDQQAHIDLMPGQLCFIKVVLCISDTTCPCLIMTHLANVFRGQPQGDFINVFKG